MSEYQMLNVAGSEDEEEEDKPTPIRQEVSEEPPPPCDQEAPPSMSEESNNSAVIKEESQPSDDQAKQPVPDSVKRRQSLNIKVKEPSADAMTAATDEVDKSMPVRPDPEGQTGSSPSSPNSPDPVTAGGGDSRPTDKPADMDSSCSSCAAMQQLPNKLDMTKSPAFLKLKAELDSAREQLQSKEQQVDKLSKIRDEVEDEVQELTASLFQEAHRMVGEANEKRVSTEKCLAEATMKIDGLETEVTALKALVLTSTPSQPNRHLHPQLKASSPSSRSKTSGKDHRRQGSDGSGGKPSGGLPGKKLSFSLNASPRSAKSSPTCHNGPPLVVGAGGLNSDDGISVLNDSLAEANHTAFCDLGQECDNTCGFYEERVLIDPGLRLEYLEWKKAPTLDRAGSRFLDRIYREDVDPCLNFAAAEQPSSDSSASAEPSAEPSAEASSCLKDVVSRAVHEQTICIVPLKTDEVSKGCPLLNSDRVLCKYTVKCDGREFRVSQLARNRIAAVCNLLNYLDYIKKGMVKSHHNEVYKEILHLRKQIVLARLGFSPD